MMVEPISTVSPPSTPQTTSSASSVTAGIGILLHRTSKGTFVIRGVQPGSVAYSSGKVKAGDILLSIDGKPIQGKPIEYVSSIVQGPPRTSVILGLQHAYGKVQVPLVRGCGHAVASMHHELSDLSSPTSSSYKPSPRLIALASPKLHSPKESAVEEPSSSGKKRRKKNEEEGCSAVMQRDKAEKEDRINVMFALKQISEAVGGEVKASMIQWLTEIGSPTQTQVNECIMAIQRELDVQGGGQKRIEQRQREVLGDEATEEAKDVAEKSNASVNTWRALKSMPLDTEYLYQESTEPNKASGMIESQECLRENIPRSVNVFLNGFKAEDVVFSDDSSSKETVRTSPNVWKLIREVPTTEDYEGVSSSMIASIAKEAFEFPSFHMEREEVMNDKPSAEELSVSKDEEEANGSRETLTTKQGSMIVEHSGPQVDHSKVISSGDGQVRGSGLDRLRFLAGLPLDHGGGEEEETQEPLRSPGSETMQMKNLWTSLKQIPIIMDDYSVSVAAKDPTSDNSFSELCASVDPFLARQSSSLTSEASQDFASLDHGANMEAPAAEHEVTAG
eukprot:758969-Hanusia_phi.AAC.1